MRTDLLLIQLQRNFGNMYVSNGGRYILKLGLLWCGSCIFFNETPCILYVIFPTDIQVW